ncbi:MAG: diguanylate cyclase [Dehalococcoidia bacterium]|nr:MAG: diguanylate cyclase [Dehalococcoidia bacterium]
MQIFLQIAADQLNYIHMVCGIAYLILAVTAYSLALEDKNNAPWRWVALFALSQVISAWLGTLEHSVLQGSFGMIQVATDWIGWAALAQFGRSWNVIGRSALRGYWIFGVIALAVIASITTSSGELIKSIVGIAVTTAVVPAIIQTAKNWPVSSKGSIRGCAVTVPVLLTLKISLPVLLSHYGGENILSIGTSILIQIAILVEIGLVIAWVIQLVRVYEKTRAIILGENVVYYKNQWWIIVIIMAVFVCGFFATAALGIAEAGSLNNALMRETKIAALAVDPEIIKNMTGTEADLKTADYKRLYEQQLQIGQVNSLYMWTYILLEKDDKIVILTDSKPMDAPDHTPVTLYSDAPSGITEVFKSGKAQLIDPYKDQWGMWITSLVPVTDPFDGKVIAVQGIDIPAEKFYAVIKQRQFQPILITWLFAIVLLGAYYFERRLRESLRLVRQSENKYSAIINNSMDSILVISDSKIRFANNSAVQFMGFGEKEIIDEYFAKYLHPDDQQLLRMRYVDRMAGKALSPIVEFRVIRANGEIRIVHCTGVKIDYMGKPADLVQLRDITENKKAELELQEAHRSLEDIIDSLPDSTFVIDRQRKVIAWNQAMEKMTGVSKSQIIGKGDYEYSLPFYGDRRPIAIDMVFTRDYDYPEHYYNVYRSGNTMFAENYAPSIYGGKGAYLWATASILFDSSGQIKGAIETIRDITERKQLEEEISTSNEMLKQWLDESERTKHEMMITGEMIRKIDSCASLDEAGKNACIYLDKLFDEDTGFIAIINEENNLLEPIGAFDKLHCAGHFRLSDCWATKLKRPYIYSRSAGGQLCAHMRDSSSHTYVEVPLVAQNKLLGLLCIQCNLDESDNEQVSRWLEQRKAMINRIAAQLSLALANTQLRVTLRRQAIIDPLTGLYNRRYMHEVLENELRRSLRAGKSIGFIMGDIDNFKKFNDLYGHDIGDQLLKSVANTMKAVVRLEDIVCRYGGEEFLIILPSASLQDTYQRALQINDVVKSIVLNSGSNKIKGVTISLGVSAYPEQGKTGDELIAAADKAMYQAKNEGRDRVCTALCQINHASQLVT